MNIEREDKRLCRPEYVVGLSNVEMDKKTFHVFSINLFYHDHEFFPRDS